MRFRVWIVTDLGQQVKDIHTVTQRLVNLHLQNLDSQVIMQVASLLALRTGTYLMAACIRTMKECTIRPAGYYTIRSRRQRSTYRTHILFISNSQSVHHTPRSPRRPKSMVAAYSTLPTPPLPLGFDETTMTIKQILALFTPPEAFSDHNRILNKIQFIFSQLDEPFDLQRGFLTSICSRSLSAPLQDSFSWWTKKNGTRMEPRSWR